MNEAWRLAAGTEATALTQVGLRALSASCPPRPPPRPCRPLPGDRCAGAPLCSPGSQQHRPPPPHQCRPGLRTSKSLCWGQPVHSQRATPALVRRGARPRVAVIRRPLPGGGGGGGLSCACPQTWPLAPASPGMRGHGWARDRGQRDVPAWGAPHEGAFCRSALATRSGWGATPPPGQAMRGQRSSLPPPPRGPSARRRRRLWLAGWRRRNPPPPRRLALGGGGAAAGKAPASPWPPRHADFLTRFAQECVPASKGLAQPPPPGSVPLLTTRRVGLEDPAPPLSHVPRERCPTGKGHPCSLAGPRSGTGGG